MKNKSAVAKNIRAFREALSLTQSQFASAIKVSQSCVAQWESGDREISLSGAMAIRKEFGIPIDYLLDIKKDKNPNAFLVRQLTQMTSSLSKEEVGIIIALVQMLLKRKDCDE